MDLEKLAENIGLEVEDFNEVFELYVETTSPDLEELKAALVKGDAQEVHKTAHSIKGSSGNLGLDELYELAGEIDDHARKQSLDGLEDIVRVFSEKYQELVEDFKRSR